MKKKPAKKGRKAPVPMSSANLAKFVRDIRNAVGQIETAAQMMDEEPRLDEVGFLNYAIFTRAVDSLQSFSASAINEVRSRKIAVGDYHKANANPLQT